jgi:hypothetical protein
VCFHMTSRHKLILYAAIGVKFQHGGQRFETKRKQRGRKSNYSWDSFVWTCKISRIQIVVYFKWLIIYQMIQIVVYLQSLLRQRRQVLFTHWIGGSKYPTILYCTCINTDANLLVCLPESWSHYSFSDRWEHKIKKLTPIFSLHFYWTNC